MYSPHYDNPKSLSTVYRWLIEAGLENISVKKGHNGIVAKGKKKSIGL